MNTEISTDAWDAVWQRVQKNSRTKEIPGTEPEDPLPGLLSEKRESIRSWEMLIRKGCFRTPEVSGMLCEKRRQWRLLQGWLFLSRGEIPTGGKQTQAMPDSALLFLREQYLRENAWAEILRKLSESACSASEKQDYGRAAEEDESHGEVIRRLLLGQLSG